MDSGTDIQTILEEIDDALGAWRALRGRSTCEDCSDQPLEDRVAVKERLAGTLARLAPRGSRHEKRLRSALASATPLSAALRTLVDALTALKRDHEIRVPVASAPAEPVRADALAGFLDTARRLSGQGCKDAAVVLAGATLEQHLLRLCVGHGIAPAETGESPDLLNAALARHGIYDAAERSRIASWLVLWGDAVHCRHANYSAREAQRLIEAVAEFLARHPG